MVHEFKENESYRKRKRQPNSILIYHEIISFGTSDNVSREIAEDIARAYMKLRGYTGMFAGAVHEEKDNIHVHVMASGLHLRTGKAFRLSRTDLQHLKQGIQKYHLDKYPEIAHSNCEHGRGKQNKNDKQWHFQKRNDLKIEVEETVTKCLKKASTKREFLELLRGQDFHHYERNHDGLVTGIIAGNRKFRFNRLGIDLERLQALPIDLIEEERTLAEIEALRRTRNERSHAIDR